MSHRIPSDSVLLADVEQSVAVPHYIFGKLRIGRWRRRGLGGGSQDLVVAADRDASDRL